MTIFDIRCDYPLTDNEIVPRSCISIALPKKGTERTSLSVTCTRHPAMVELIRSAVGAKCMNKVYGRNSLGGDDLCCRGEKHGSCSCTFTAQQSFEKHRTRRSAKLEASERFIFGKETAKPRKGYGNWLLPARVSSRGCRTSYDRADLAGNAAVA
jgi:hypothetical protein